jgi:FlaA1/EpsC-like NDP-sugar epimerase
VLWFGFGVYKAACAFSTWRDVGSILLLAGATVALSMLSGYLVDRLTGVPRSLPLFHFGLLVAGFFSVRVFARLCASLASERKSDNAFSRQDCILVGETKLASVYIEVLRQERRSTSSIAGLLTDDRIDQETLVNSVPILGRPADLQKVLMGLKVHAIVVRQLVLLTTRSALADELLTLLDKEGIEIVDFYAQMITDPV